MADIAELLKVMQEQMQLQREQIRQQEERHRQQEVSNEERHKQQLALMQQQMEDTRKAGETMVSQHQTPPIRLHCRAMEGPSATLRDVCQRQLYT